MRAPTTSQSRFRADELLAAAMVSLRANLLQKKGFVDPYKSPHADHATGGGNGFMWSVGLLMNALLGSGILGQAYAASQSGYVLYISLLVVMLVCANLAIFMLIKLCCRLKLNTYEELGMQVLGKRGHQMVTSAIALENVGAMTSYFVILGDNLPDLLSKLGADGIFTNRIFILVVVAIVVVFPMALQRTLRFQSVVSASSMASMVFITTIIVMYKHKAECPLPHAAPGDDDCAIKPVVLNIESTFVFPTLAFSFVCHTALLPIFTELRNRSVKKMQWVANCALGAGFCIYLLAGIFGYLTFRGQVKSDIFKNYEDWRTNDDVVTLIRTLYCCSICGTISLIHFPLRKTLSIYFFPNQPFSQRRHVLLTIFGLSFILILAISIPNVRNIFGPIGATASVMLVFLLPGLLWLKAPEALEEQCADFEVPEEGSEVQVTLEELPPLEDTSDGLDLWKRPNVYGAVFAMLGLLVAVVSLTGVVASWIEGK